MPVISWKEKAENQEFRVILRYRVGGQSEVRETEDKKTQNALHRKNGPR